MLKNVPMRNLSTIFLITTLAFAPGFAYGQLEDLSPGLIVQWKTAAGKTIESIDAAPALDIPTMPVDPRLGLDSVEGVWRGLLLIKGAEPRTFYTHAAGEFTVAIDGKVVIQGDTKTPEWTPGEPVKVSLGLQPIEVRYRQVGTRPRFALFWSADSYPIEPIAPNVYYHDAEDMPDSAFDHGRKLVRIGRCVACHQLPGEPSLLQAPALDQMAGSFKPQWLTQLLMGKAKEGFAHPTVMNFSESEANALTAWFVDRKPSPAPKLKKPNAKDKKPNGRDVFMTVGCLACHQHGDLGAKGVFSGGDLKNIAAKRPSDFFEKWLTDPASLNRDHRMPIFDLNPGERVALAGWLSSQGDSSSPAKVKASNASNATARKLFADNNCQACHTAPDDFGITKIASKPLTKNPDWSASCLTDSTGSQPEFAFNAIEEAAIKTYVEQMQTHAPKVARLNGERLMEERNCVSCHARELSSGLSETVLNVAKDKDKFTQHVPAMTPPSLASVGDKLTRDALLAAISREDEPHRPYLQVRMPRFAMPKSTAEEIVDHLIVRDRNPAPLTAPSETLDREALFVAGSRLVTSDGFGCTSCHQVGKTMPPKAPLNTRGPDLSMLGQRIRKPWFDRWVRNPARIVAGMEMPSVQIPVKGVLKEHLDSQLNAVWHTLNTKGFEPPEPNPLRVVRRSGRSLAEETAAVLTDVVHDEKKVYIKPLLIGLPNRHNILYDLETGHLVAWRIGNVARQRARGKRWNWETAGAQLYSRAGAAPEMRLKSNGQWLDPQLQGQFVTEFDTLFHESGGVRFTHRLRFGDSADNSQLLRFEQTFQPTPDQTGFTRTLRVFSLKPGQQLEFSLPNAKPTDAAGAVTIGLANRQKVRLLNSESASATRDKGVWRVTIESPKNQETAAQWKLQYTTSTLVDQFVAPEINLPPPTVAKLKAVPGFDVVRLPLADEFMPTGLAWRPDGSLIVTSLKGRVWSLQDTNGDELEDRTSVLSDELAAPYGAAAEADYVDVVTKYAIVRLFDANRDGHAEKMQTIASGWGHTDDYHDWVVGLPRDSEGNYLLSIPCQQDDRNEAAAHLRGKVVRVVPRSPTDEDPRPYRLEKISGGHRFPMGIAQTKQGDIFVTDNQGNYNPYNELNHVQPGVRFGFINKIEKKDKDFSPPLTPPAINIPHPWTRSVNGICVLESPAGIADDHFGPFAGDLIGCEYDTRRLVRMSLQKVNGQWQGAAYPFSDPDAKAEENLLGPICCSVAPDGDLYVGELRDSGWGGSNNIGALLRMRPDWKQLPAGIARVEHRQEGFEITFTQPIDRNKAADKSNYSISSATRDSTPAYGGNDRDRRVEKIDSIEVAADNQSVLLKLKDLRAGFVYDFQLKSIAAGDDRFFPAEAYYSLNTILK